MDEDLQRLTREAAAHPNDEGLARRLDHALRRAGRDDDRRARFRFKFQCDLRYEDLSPTTDPLLRSCDRCERQVRFVASVDELAEQVAQGQCVAFERRALGDVVGRVADDPRQHSAVAPGTPCLVPTDLEFVDLDGFTPPGGALDLLPPAFARHHRAVPVGLSNDVLRVVFSTTPTRDLLDDLRFMLDAEVEAALADPAAVERAIERLYPEDEPEGFLMGAVLSDPDLT